MKKLLALTIALLVAGSAVEAKDYSSCTKSKTDCKYEKSYAYKVCKTCKKHDKKACACGNKHNKKDNCGCYKTKHKKKKRGPVGETAKATGELVTAPVRGLGNLFGSDKQRPSDEQRQEEISNYNSQY